MPNGLAVSKRMSACLTSSVRISCRFVVLYIYLRTRINTTKVYRWYDAACVQAPSSKIAKAIFCGWAYSKWKKKRIMSVSRSDAYGHETKKATKNLMALIRENVVFLWLFKGLFFCRCFLNFLI